MSRIGTARHARAAYANAHGLTWDADFSLFGSGGMRTAMLHKPTNVVYKVESNYTEPEFGNRAEYRNAKLLSRIDWRNVYIPKVSLYTVEDSKVLAMEYIEGSTGRELAAVIYADDEPQLAHLSWPGRLEFHLRGRLADMHGENFKIDDKGRFVPIDLGSSRYRTEGDRRIFN